MRDTSDVVVGDNVTHLAVCDGGVGALGVCADPDTCTVHGDCEGGEVISGTGALVGKAGVAAGEESKRTGDDGDRRLPGPPSQDQDRVGLAASSTRGTRVTPPVAPEQMASGADQGATTEPRSAKSLPTRRSRRRYRIVLVALVALAVFFGFGLLAWANPMPMGSPGWWRISEMRLTNVVVMAVVAFCQAMATVSFQTVTNNRIITPSIMGFESLYVSVQTASVYFMGAAGIIALQGQVQFVLQLVLMVGLSLLLYGWLLSGKYGNLQIMLLVGIIVGGGLRSVSTFMQRLLTPSEFDILVARMFGSISNADASYLPIAIPLALGAGALLWLQSRRLNVMALGRDAAIGLGLNYKAELMKTLFLVSVLMAVSTALVGPLTFLGFLVATLAYQFSDTYDHRRILPIAVLIGFVVLSGAYFVMKNIFYAQGVVSILIELVGGTVFLVVLLRKGRL